MATVRLQILLRATIDVDLEEYREAGQQYEPGELTTEELAVDYAATLAGFFDNELNNCNDMDGSGVVDAVHTTYTLLQEA